MGGHPKYDLLQPRDEGLGGILHAAAWTIVLVLLQSELACVIHLLHFTQELVEAGNALQTKGTEGNSWGTMATSGLSDVRYGMPLTGV